jgi:HEAT repeat protein
MEILGPEILRIATNLSVLLTALSTVLLAVIVAIRFNAERRAKHRARFRRRAEPAVASVVTGRIDAKEVVPLMRKAPDEALDFLMEASARLEPKDRPKLQPLFTSLPVKGDMHEALASRNWERRLPAAERLGYLGNHDTVDDLVAALKDEVLVVRFAAARSLVALRSAGAVEPILLAFDVPGELNERRTAEILSEMGEAAVPPLVSILQNPAGKYSDSVINVASRVLGLLRAGAATAPLIPLLGHEDYRVRLNAARSLGAIGDRAALPAVAKLAKDPSWEVRNVAVQSIGKLRGEHEMHLLVAALADEAWWVRFSAAQALFSLGQPGIDALKKAAREAADRYAREMSAQVLEEHGATSKGAATP